MKQFKWITLALFVMSLSISANAKDRDHGFSFGYSSQPWGSGMGFSYQNGSNYLGYGVSNSPYGANYSFGYSNQQPNYYHSRPRPSHYPTPVWNRPSHYPNPVWYQPRPRYRPHPSYGGGHYYRPQPYFEVGNGYYPRPAPRRYYPHSGAYIYYSDSPRRTSRYRPSYLQNYYSRPFYCAPRLPVYPRPYYY